MPHIHTQPNQHDMTVSAFVILNDGQELKCLVHFHRKIEVLMQVGGHIELDETPWQSIAHELKEEAGFDISELAVLQPSADVPLDAYHVVHPVPFSMNTHRVSNGHYHSDLCFGFVATGYPKTAPADGESSDIRWLSIEALKASAETGETLYDVYANYEYLLRQMERYVSIPATDYALTKPNEQGVIYKHGAPEE